MKRQVIVVGGGASGMAAGIMAARQNAKVILLEHMDRVGKKLQWQVQSYQSVCECGLLSLQLAGISHEGARAI